MFGQIRWNAFDDIFNFQREADRLFNQLWSELPVQSPRTSAYPFQVQTSPDSWRVELPMPGIDPKNVTVDVAGNTLVIRAEDTGGRYDGETRYSQTVTVPQFLDLDRISATHRHGMLVLTLPLKESVKPRRIQIDAAAEPQKQLTHA